MGRYTVPFHWNDHKWLSERPDLVRAFQEPADTTIVDLGICRWIDPQPLCDLLLHAGTLLSGGRRLRIEMPRDPDIEQLRVQRWLDESGFWLALVGVDSPTESPISVRLDAETWTLQDYLARIQGVTYPAKALDYESIVPCTFFDATSFEDRDGVFRHCDRLRQNALAKGRARGLRLSVPLLYQTKLFLNSILPELIDNVRLHKRNDQNRNFVLYARLRRRDEPLRGSRWLAEPSPLELTPLQQSPGFFWQDDVVELVFGDNGSTIQQTYIAAKQAEGPLRSSRIEVGPSRYRRITGKHGDRIILEEVFRQSLTSLPESERVEHGLPLKVTGLHYIAKALQGADCVFGVQSGDSTVVVRSAPADSPLPQSSATTRQIRGVSTYPHSPGVHFFFRFSSCEGRPSTDWATALPRQPLETQTDWWSCAYPARFARAHVVPTYAIPAEAHRDDVVICRARHLIPKNQLFSYLREVNSRGLRIVFYEQPQSVALWVYENLRLLLPELDGMIVPIVSDALRVRIAGTTQREARISFLSAHNSSTKAWWDAVDSPVKCVRDLFLRSRQADSEEFWNAVRANQSTFIAADVKWTSEWELSGGYLCFGAALRAPEIRKLVRRRLVHLAQVLRCSRVRPASDDMRLLAAEVERTAYLLPDDAGRTGVLGGVMTTGRRAGRHGGFTKSSGGIVHIPTLVYPEDCIVGPSGVHKGRRQLVRALDWLAPSMPIDEARAQYRRLGTSDRIVAVSHEPFATAQRQAAPAMWSVWQRHSLIRIGHFSYGRHHYYAWLDLLRFLNDRSPDAAEMTREMGRQIAEWKADYIFYPRHEVSEALVDRLVMENTITRQQTWPLSEIDFFTPAQPLVARKSVAIVIDDAVVTGHTIRTATSQLMDRGFHCVHSLVILERCDSRSAIGARGSATEHFAWWSVRIPDLGSSVSCRVCQGVQHLTSVQSATSAESIRACLETWVRQWTAGDNLHRFQTAIESVSYVVPLSKSHGHPQQKDVLLRDSHATAVWALDLIHRLDRWGFLFERPRHELGEAEPEIATGVLLHNWGELTDGDKRDLVALLVITVFVDRRPSARRAAAVALLSLGRSELRSVRRFVSKAVCERGVEYVDSAALIHAVAIRSTMPAESPAQWLRELANETRATSVDQSKAGGVRDLVDVLTSLHGELGVEWAALSVLGLPGQSHLHAQAMLLLESLLSDAKRGENRRTRRDKILLLQTYLDPVRRCLDQRRELFGSFGIADEAVSALDWFDRMANPARPGVDETPDALLRVCDQLLEVLVRGGHDGTSFRRVLAGDFVHYVPVMVYDAIRGLVEATHDKFDVGDFEIDQRLDGDATDALAALYKHDEGSWNAREQLYSRDVVGCGKAVLLQALSWCLSDVKHAKKKRNGLGTQGRPPYMQIEHFVSPEPVGPFAGLGVRLTNLATQEQVDPSLWNSWALTVDRVHRAGGRTAYNYSELTSLLTRELVFPAIRYRKTKDVANDGQHDALGPRL